MTEPRDAARKSEFELYLDTVNFLNATGCTSFTQLSLMNPELWSRLRMTPVMRLRIAGCRGWPTSAKTDPREPEGVDLMINVLLNFGCDDAYILWLERPALCEALHRAGWLERFLASVGIEVLPATAQDGVHAGLLESFPDVRELLERRPDAGWTTRGGPVFRIAELILARYLEHCEIAFKVVTSEQGWCHFISAEGVWIGFASGPASPALRPTARGVRVILDDGLLRLPGDIVAYAYHITVSLIAAGILTHARHASYTELLLPEPRGTF